MTRGPASECPLEKKKKTGANFGIKYDRFCCWEQPMKLNNNLESNRLCVKQLGVKMNFS